MSSKKSEEPEFKRQCTEDTSAEAELKRKELLSHTLVCPITLELPFVPVMAEDGRVYEKQAIEQHIKNNPCGLRSPYTNESMGARLVESHQMKSMIDVSIQNGAITGDLATTWLEKRKNQGIVEQWKKDAEKGNGKAAYMLGRAYLLGGLGLEEDDQTAFSYFKIASEAGDVHGQAMYGSYLSVSEENLSISQRLHGIALIAESAGSGSSLACLILGAIYSGHADDPNFQDFPIQRKKAIQLLEKGIQDSQPFSGFTPSYVPMSLPDDCMDELKKLLEEVKSET